MADGWPMRWPISESKTRYSPTTTCLLPRTWSGLAWSGMVWPTSITSAASPITHIFTTDRPLYDVTNNPIDTRHTQPIDLLNYPIINPSGKASKLKNTITIPAISHTYPPCWLCLTLARLLRQKVQSLARSKAKKLDSDRTLISFFFFFFSFVFSLLLLPAFFSVSSCQLCFLRNLTIPT